MTNSTRSSRQAVPTRRRPKASTALAQRPAADLDGLGEISDEPTLLDANLSTASPHEAIAHLFSDARRRVIPVRRAFVQTPPGPRGVPRAGVLAKLVTDRQQVALDLLLLRLALEPIIGPDDPIQGQVWARLLDKTPATISRTWQVLDQLGLVRRIPHRPVELLREDGSGKPYSHPGAAGDRQPYFGLPRRYWTDGWHTELGMPGKAILLILLAETNQSSSQTLHAATEKIGDYYGISTTTARRGIDELKEHSLLGERWTQVPAPRSPLGHTLQADRWLKNPFSWAYRDQARKMDQGEAGRRRIPPPPAAAPVDGGTPAGTPDD